MSIASLLPLPVVLPLVGAVAAPLVTKIHQRLPLFVGIAAMLGSLGVLIAAVPGVFGGDGHVLTHFFSNEHPKHGQALGIAFAADPFGLVFALLTAGVGTLLLLSALSEFGDLGHKELGWLACLMQLLLAALVGAALTADSVDLFVWFEVAALSSYGLTGFFLERPIAVEAAFKNTVLTSMASYVVFAGAAMLYTTSGALNFGWLNHAIPVAPERAQLVAIALLVAGFATKAGVMPCHGWLPDAHVPVPGAVSALFSGLMVNLGVVALARLGLQLFPDVHALLGLLTGLGIASAVLGAALALCQDDLKRLLAWDTVSQTGLLVAGFASRDQDGVGGALYHLVNHCLFKSLMFLCAGAIVHSTGKTKLSEMRGLARRRPWLTAAFTVGCASIAGVPPFNGYSSLELIHEGLFTEPLVFALALLAQVITIAALARAAYLGFYRRRKEPYEHMEHAHAGMRVSLMVLAAACVGFGILTEPFVEYVSSPAASVLLHPAAYAHDALGASLPVPPNTLMFHLGDPLGLAIELGELILGALLLTYVLRRRTTIAPLRRLQRLHTGSVNDYAAYLAGGVVLAAGFLLG